MAEQLSDVHAIEPEEFVRRVHTFEHWFESVEGYLGGLAHGHRRDLHETELDPAERDRLVSILCDYAVGEMAALEASSGLIRIAPNQPTKIFLSTQVVDEGRHVEVIHDRLTELGVVKPEDEIGKRAGAGIRSFRDHLLQLVDAGDWDAAIFAQNIALEAMEFTVFQAHAERADPITKDLLERILRDERRHMGFGENELGRRLRRDERRRLWIQTVKSELDRLVLDTFDEALHELQIPRARRPDLARGYLAAVRRLGFE